MLIGVSDVRHNGTKGQHRMLPASIWLAQRWWLRLHFDQVWSHPAAGNHGEGPQHSTLTLTLTLALALALALTLTLTLVCLPALSRGLGIPGVAVPSVGLLLVCGDPSARNFSSPEAEDTSGDSMLLICADG